MIFGEKYNIYTENQLAFSTSGGEVAHLTDPVNSTESCWYLWLPSLYPPAAQNKGCLQPKGHLNQHPSNPHRACPTFLPRWIGF